MKRILLVYGTRPEAIKMCPLAAELARRPAFETLVLSTGQHRELLKGSEAIFGVKPDFSLSVMREGQSLTSLTARLLRATDPILKKTSPDLVLVHGDTCTAFAAALAAFYRRIPVGHVEAGLRTHDLASPFPEELYRRTIDQLSALHFAPTKAAEETLLAEGAHPSHVFVTGNTVIDALRYTVREDYTHPLLAETAGLRRILLTTHRRENLGEPMLGAFRALADIIRDNPDTALIFPVHKNPAVREPAHRLLGGQERIFLTEPQAPDVFHNFLASCFLVLTDSGGIQEEAAHLCKPTLVLRDTTERPEALATGGAKLVGLDEGDIRHAISSLLYDRNMYESMVKPATPFGDGHACEKITNILEEFTNISNSL